MIISAFQIAGGIQINRQIGAGEDPSEMVLSSEMVFEGDPGWAEAMAAVANFQAVPEPPSERTLEQVKEAAIAQITQMRGQARLAYITDLPGQDMLYTAKYEEAGAYLTDPTPDPAEYPLIMSEVGVTATTAEEVAQVFLNLNALWRQAAGAIDAACFGAEAVVHAATTPIEIDAALIALAAQLAP